MINRLLVPYIKAAVMDRRLFLYKAHPARRLLNVVAEASEGNRGEGPQERELMARVEETIDRLVADFNEDIAIFETLEQELRSFLEQHRKRIEVAERRATESQRGQERLEQAREGVSVDLSISRDRRANCRRPWMPSSTSTPHTIWPRSSCAKARSLPAMARRSMR